MRDMLAQRVYGLCCGHEDLNDHDRLREDVLVQTALGRDPGAGQVPHLEPAGNERHAGACVDAA